MQQYSTEAELIYYRTVLYSICEQLRESRAAPLIAQAESGAVFRMHMCNACGAEVSDVLLSHIVAPQTPNLEAHIRTAARFGCSWRKAIGSDRINRLLPIREL